MFILTIILLVCTAVYFVVSEVRIDRITKQRNYWYGECMRLAIKFDEPLGDDQAESCEVKD